MVIKLPFQSMEHSLALLTLVAFKSLFMDGFIVEEVFLPHMWAFLASFVRFLSYEVGL